jgi:UDP-3-O-[3-hydroxymyristoyl] glucosamine N-acyltransferase
MNKLQTTTHIGVYSMFAGFLNIFQDVKIEDFFEITHGLTFGEVIAAILPFLIGLYSMIYNEENNDSKEPPTIDKTDTINL